MGEDVGLILNLLKISSKIMQHCWANNICMMLASFELAFKLQQFDANTKESKDTVLESDDFPLRRSPLLFDNNL